MRSLPHVTTTLSAVIIIISYVMCPLLTQFKASGKIFVFVFCLVPHIMTILSAVIIIISCVMCPNSRPQESCSVFCSVPDVMTIVSAVIIIISCVMCPHLTEFKASGFCFVLYFCILLLLFSTPCHDYTFSTYNNYKLCHVSTLNPMQGLRKGFCVQCPMS